MTNNNNWLGKPGVPVSDEIRAEIKAAAKALCSYPSGPNAANSCCSGIGRCEMKAAIAEITRLRAELATARKDALKEAAQRAAHYERMAYQHGNLPVDDPHECAAQVAREIEASIRALKGEGDV
jgi:hypothetical protein